MIGSTLGRYLSSRFFRMIFAVFATIFSLGLRHRFRGIASANREYRRRHHVVRRLPVPAAHPSGIGAGAAVLRPVRLDGRIPQPDAQARTAGGARLRHFGLAVHGAADPDFGADRHRLDDHPQPAVGDDEAARRPDRAVAVRARWLDRERDIDLGARDRGRRRIDSARRQDERKQQRADRCDGICL